MKAGLFVIGLLVVGVIVAYAYKIVVKGMDPSEVMAEVKWELGGQRGEMPEHLVGKKTYGERILDVVKGDDETAP